MVDSNRLGAWTLIASVFTASIAGVWFLQDARISDRDKTIDLLRSDIETLTDAKSWRVPETIKRLTAISAKLDEQFKTQDSLATLAMDNVALESRGRMLESQLEEARRKQTEAEATLNEERKKLSRAFADSKAITVGSGGSAELVKNQVTVGLAAIYPTSGARVVLNNSSTSMEVGEYREFGALGKSCRVTLVYINKYENSADFKLVCVESNPFT